MRSGNDKAKLAVHNWSFRWHERHNVALKLFCPNHRLTKAAVSIAELTGKSGETTMALKSLAIAAVLLGGALLGGCQSGALIGSAVPDPALS